MMVVVEGESLRLNNIFTGAGISPASLATVFNTNVTRIEYPRIRMNARKPQQKDTQNFYTTLRCDELLSFPKQIREFVTSGLN